MTDYFSLSASNVGYLNLENWAYNEKQNFNLKERRPMFIDWRHNWIIFNQYYCL